MTTPRHNRRFSHASRHASARILERCRLAEHEVIKLLDSGACIDLGKKPGCDRRHLLFWSQPDQQAFVALRDALTGTLVTLLPLDFHERLAWKVGPEQIVDARKQAARLRTGPARTGLFAHYLDAEGNPKTRCLWKSAPGEDIKASLAQLRRNPPCLKAVTDREGFAGSGNIRMSLREGGSGPRLDLPEATTAALLRKLVDCGLENRPEDTDLTELPRPQGTP